jgi:protein-tyrosine phosphatase
MNRGRARRTEAYIPPHRDYPGPAQAQTLPRLDNRSVNGVPCTRRAGLAQGPAGWNCPGRPSPASSSFRAGSRRRQSTARDNLRKAMSPDLFWIPGPWRGKLAVATRPRGGDWLEDEASRWRRAGLDVIVSLLENDEAAQLELNHENDVAELTGLRFISFPIPDRGVPDQNEDALRLLREISKALDGGSNVAVHCRQGVGRSGMIAAGMLVISGIQPEKAIETVSTARRQTVPETASQLRRIQQLPSEHLAPAR